MYSRILLIVVCLNAVTASRILLVFPTPAPSHYFLGNALARALAEAGHDVTMVSPFEDKNPPRNGTYRNIVLTSLQDVMASHNFFQSENQNPLLGIMIITKLFNQLTEKVFEDPNFQELIHSAEQFDVAIIEIFNNDALNGLAYHFKVPLIYFSTLGPNMWINPLIANPSPSSYIPNSLLKYSPTMSFCQRTSNWIFNGAIQLYRSLFFYPTQNRIMKKHLPDVPDLSVVSSNASLVFLNNHESTNQAVPHVPSMIDIGGFHVKPPKDLPKDLKDFMNSAKEGVVYFSMGSNIKPSDMPKEKKEAILKALGKLKQKVLWKWNEDTMSDKPDNVKLSKWFPQQDILGHPNTKLFITHGGLLSATETIYHGVPVLVFPIFGDQKMNGARAEMNGFGLTLPFSEITEEKLSDALNKLLNDPNYRNNAKRRSQLLLDRPIKPVDLAVYWTEFVIRHKGALHLRVAGVDLPWYKYHLLDVIAFVILVSTGITYALYVVLKNVCCSKRKSQIKVKKN